MIWRLEGGLTSLGRLLGSALLATIGSRIFGASGPTGVAVTPRAVKARRMIFANSIMTSCIMIEFDGLCFKFNVNMSWFRLGYGRGGRTHYKMLDVPLFIPVMRALLASRTTCRKASVHLGLYRTAPVLQIFKTVVDAPSWSSKDFPILHHWAGTTYSYPCTMMVFFLLRFPD